MIPCKKCLLSEINNGELYRSVQERIALLDDSIRADEHQRTARLDICKQCDDLTDGMCAQCGCFVELRTAKKDTRCPAKRW